MNEPVAGISGETATVSAGFPDAPAAARAALALRSELEGTARVVVSRDTPPATEARPAGLVAKIASTLGLGGSAATAPRLRVTVASADPLVRERARRLLRVQGALDTSDAVEDEDGEPKFAQGFATAAPALRAHLKELRGTERDWPTVETRYRYGWQMANRPDYHEREWADASAELRADWEQRHPDVPWSETEPFVRKGWAAARGR